MKNITNMKNMLYAMPLVAVALVLVLSASFVLADSDNETETCFGEGEDLGAVVPANLNNVCCEGLVAEIPEGIVGTMGTCVKAVDSEETEIDDSDESDVEDSDETDVDDDNESEIEDEVEKENKSKPLLTKAEIKEKIKEKIKAKLNLKEGEEVESELEIEQEGTGEQAKFKFKLSNGRNALIKIMPSTASATALARLRLKVCNESNNCTIQLKEVGEGNPTKLAYELKSKKKAKLFGLFSSDMEVEAEVDAETGEVIQSKKPWWAFLATESDE